MKKGSKAAGSLMLLLLLFVLFYFRRGDMGSPHGRQPELQTFQLRDGWGYKILMNKKTLIYQPTIPTIDSLRPFPTERSARLTGQLVLDRLKHNRDFSITIDDLKHSLSD